MRKIKKSTLMGTYYRSFLLLIVIPLVLVFLGAEIAVGYTLRSTSIETIDVLQENIASTLSSDVRTNSLQLSHFVYAGDGEFMQVAAKTHESSGTAWYAAEQQLQQAFRTAMVPSQDIVGGGFYMRDGGAVYMKDDITLPQEEVRGADWYQEALRQPNRVTVGVYDTSRTRLTSTAQKGRQLILVTAMASDLATDKSGQIEVVAFFTVSKVGDILWSQRQEEMRGASVILDREGHVLFGDMGDEEIRAYFEENLGQFVPGSQVRRAALLGDKARSYLFRVRPVPDTEWLLVTFVEESSLSQSFYSIGGALALIVCVLLGLFYFYSRYFLNAIITPVHAVCEGMERLDGNDLEVRVEPTGQQEIQELMVSFNQMVCNIRDMLRLTEETMQKKHEAEIQALQSQINPHFIVNTLNSIRFMAQVAQFDGIRRMAEALVSIVSCSFRSSASFYTVKDELEMLETYVYLMQIRYSNSFEVAYEVEEDCLNYCLPRLTLQPVVENAITHGLDEMTEELGQIRISAYRRDEYLCLSVWDNGIGMSREQIELLKKGRPRRQGDNTSIGLENVQARIRLNFGEAAHIDIESERGQYTEVTLRLPLELCTLLEEEEEQK